MSKIKEWGPTFIILLGLILWGVYSMSERSSEPSKPHKAKESANADDYMKKMAERTQAWATVVKEKELAPGENLRLVEVPDIQFGVMLTVTRCFIYTNAEYRVAQFTCPTSEGPDMRSMSGDESSSK